MPDCGVRQLINLRHREGVFRTCPIQICKIDTEPPISILIFHYHYVSQSFGKEHLSYGCKLIQLFHLFSYGILMRSCRPSQPLLLWHNFRVYVNLCIIKFRSTPSTSYKIHANTSMFCTNANKISTQFSSGRLFPTWNHLSVYGKTGTLISSLVLSTAADLSSSSNCCNGLQSICSFC